MTSYSIYGANILSTLAGEFGYSISFALVFIFLGTLHRGLERSRYDWLFAVNGLILMSLVLSHIVTTIALCIVAPSLLLLHRRWRAVGYMAAVFGLGFCLTAFWGLPFVDKIHWVANVDWVPLKAFKDLLPPEIRFIAAIGVLGMAFAVARKEWALIPLGWITVAMLILFFVLPRGMLWNGRMLPFFYFSLHLWAAYGATWLVATVRRHHARPSLPTREDGTAHLSGGDCRGLGDSRGVRQHYGCIDQLELLGLRTEGTVGRITGPRSISWKHSHTDE